MAINYDRMREMFIRLITQDGRPVTVRNKVNSAFDPVEGTVSVAYVDTKADAVFVPITETNKPDTLIEDTDMWTFVTEEVVKDDLIVDSSDSKEWQVVYVRPYYPGPVKIGWKAQVRA